MEEQYLVSLEAARALKAAVPRLQHVTILTSASEIADDLRCPWGIRRAFVNTLTSGLSAADRAKVRVFQLVTPGASGARRFGPHTYVHAKTWVFDDELAVIGSANCNKRGWESDSEVDAFIFDEPASPTSSSPTFAQAVRMQLWAEHLNVPSSSLADGVASASHWLSPPSGARIARYNPTAGTDSPGVVGCQPGLVDPGAACA
jgi:phosphatidylserine/phosphatidylglycerophosphate/cardiolipin synthase-like enzyme